MRVQITTPAVDSPTRAVPTATARVCSAITAVVTPRDRSYAADTALTTNSTALNPACGPANHTASADTTSTATTSPCRSHTGRRPTRSESATKATRKAPYAAHQTAGRPRPESPGHALASPATPTT